MEKKLYTIGKTAKLMGIQAQLLRHYCDIGLITPEYIDPDNGYRYFSFEQFPFIDRTRFLLGCGLGLKAIKRVLQDDDIPFLIELLNQEREEKKKELQRTQDCIHTIEWYINYFAYNNTHDSDAPFEIKSFDKRYLFAVRCPENYQPTDLYNLLNQVKNQEQYRNLKLTRQFTVIIDYDALLTKKLKRYYVGIFTMEPPKIRSEHILEIPAGEYYCFRADIHNESWDPNQIKIPLADKKEPSLVLASEYESSFSSYNNSPHELQIFFDRVDSFQT